MPILTKCVLTDGSKSLFASFVLSSMVLCCDADGIVKEFINGVSAHRLRGAALESCLQELSAAAYHDRSAFQPNRFRFKKNGRWTFFYEQDILVEVWELARRLQNEIKKEGIVIAFAQQTQRSKRSSDAVSIDIILAQGQRRFWMELKY